jgi:hypothetical protein
MKTIIATLSIFSVLTMASLNGYGQDPKNDTTHVVKKDKMKLLVMPSSASTEAVANSPQQKVAPAPAQQAAQPPVNKGQKSSKGKKKN